MERNYIMISLIYHVHYFSVYNVDFFYEHLDYFLIMKCTLHKLRESQYANTCTRQTNLIRIMLTSHG